jgi:membrane protease YdiL (CAAX protease family)
MVNLTETLSRWGLYSILLAVFLLLSSRLGYFKLDVKDSWKQVKGLQVFIAFCLFFLFAFVAQVIILTLFYLMPKLILYKSTLMMIAYLLQCLVIGWYALKVLKKPILTKRELIGAWVFGVLTCLLVFPQIQIVFRLLEEIIQMLYPFKLTEQDVVQQLRLQEGFLEVSSMVLIITIFVPIIEEIFFRGFLQSWLSQKMSVWPAIFATSTLFALFHATESQGASNVVILAAIFWLSCFLGIVYEKKKSLAASIGLHMAFNGLISTTLLLGLDRLTE